MTAATTTVRTVRWPVEPLITAAGSPPASELAARIGVSARTIWRWHHNGLTDEQADRAAIAIDQHPAIIWDHWHHMEADLK